MNFANPEIWTLIERAEIEALVAATTAADGLTVRAFTNVSEALGTAEPPGGFVLCIDSAGRFESYLTIIKRFHKNFFFFDTVVFGDRKAAEALEREYRIGVDRYVPLPADEEEFVADFTHLAALRRLKSGAKIIGRSRALNEVLETVLQVAPTEVPVLIEGESGSGKEVTARAIHLMSRRRERAFEAINCGSFAESLLESELFGHERGSFTGAVSRRLGLFERADGGTLFLDEVGEMSLNMQVKLLRVIETGDFLRVGGAERVHTDVRLVAATNRELDSSVQKGEFRRDLYYRLKVIRIQMPPLRSRREDIPPLVNYLLRHSTVKHGKTVRGVDARGMELLVNHPWPGNVRELSNAIDTLVVLSKGAAIGHEEVASKLHRAAFDGGTPDLPVHVQKSREQIERELILNSLLSLNNDVKEILHLLKGDFRPESGRWGRWMEVKEATTEDAGTLETIEREAIREALIASGGNRRKAALRLGISERTLYRRLKEYNLA